MGLFKVGDRVRIISHRIDVDLNWQIGRIGVIIEVEDNAYGISLNEVINTWYYSGEEIELIEKSQTSLSDKVNPSHYKKGSVECIDAIKAAVIGKSGFEGYLVGNVIKYLWRYEDKGGEEDKRKADWYLKKLIDERST